MLDTASSDSGSDVLPASPASSADENQDILDSYDLGRLRDCISKVREGNTEAIAQLYSRYFDRSVRLAKSKLNVGEDHLIDDEQAAMSALESLVVRMRSGSYADIDDHLTLWKLLARIINRKLIKYRRSMYGRTRSPELPFLRVLQADGDSSAGAGLPIAGSEPSPMSAMIANDTLNFILNSLSDPDSRTVLLLRLEGYSHAEIADKLQHSRNWVQRRAKIIQRVAKSLLFEDE